MSSMSPASELLNLRVIMGTPKPAVGVKSEGSLKDCASKLCSLPNFR